MSRCSLPVAAERHRTPVPSFPVRRKVRGRRHSLLYPPPRPTSPCPRTSGDTCSQARPGIPRLALQQPHPGRLCRSLQRSQDIRCCLHEIARNTPAAEESPPPAPARGSPGNLSPSCSACEGAGVATLQHLLHHCDCCQCCCHCCDQSHISCRICGGELPHHALCLLPRSSLFALCPRPLLVVGNSPYCSAPTPSPSPCPASSGASAAYSVCRAPQGSKTARASLAFGFPHPCCWDLAS
mmetsp:Transcript_17658/g.33759  ORF Transcript_17658/g.33759 Transcript_17658/m.33759 type:complete len:239 (-) Transcript_17658:630-1346(-)